MMKISFLVFALVIVFISACAKKLEDKYAAFSYRQTYCADPWGNSQTDSITLKNLGRYLDSSNVYIAGLIIRQETIAESCNACNCKTGKTITVTTFDTKTEKERLLRIGFKQVPM